MAFLFLGDSLPNLGIMLLLQLFDLLLQELNSILLLLELGMTFLVPLSELLKLSGELGHRDAILVAIFHLFFLGYVRRTRSVGAK